MKKAEKKEIQPPVQTTFQNEEEIEQEESTIEGTGCDDKKRKGRMAESSVSKRRKLEDGPGWGERSEDRVEVQDVRSWLRSMPKEGEVSDDWRIDEAPTKTRKMVQLELECSTMSLSKPETSEETPEASYADDPLPSRLEGQLPRQQVEEGIELKEKEYVRKTGKIRKKEAKELASKNRSITSWMRKPPTPTKAPEEARMMDRLGDQEPEVEGMEIEERMGFDIGKVERLALAKEKKEKLETRVMVRKLVQEMVRQVPVKSILEECLSKCVWEGEANRLWRVVEDDLELQEEMERRILQARKERRLES